METHFQADVQSPATRWRKRPSSMKQLKREIVLEMASIDRCIRYIPNLCVKQRLSRKYSAVQHSLGKVDSVTSPQRKVTRRSKYAESLERLCAPSRRRRTRCEHCLLLLSTGTSTKYCPRHGLSSR